MDILKLCWEERKAFFEEELSEQVRSQVKRLLEEALEGERTAQVAVGRYVRDPSNDGRQVPAQAGIATVTTGGTWGRGWG